MLTHLPNHTHTHTSSACTRPSSFRRESWLSCPPHCFLEHRCCRLYPGPAVLDPVTGNLTLGNNATISFHLSASPAESETVVITCIPTGPVKVHPNTVAFTQTLYVAMSAGFPSPTIHVVVDPYYSNDLSAGGARPYYVSCTAQSTVLGWTDPYQPAPDQVFSAPMVMGINGSIVNTVFPIWQDAYVLVDGAWEGIVDVTDTGANLAVTVSTAGSIIALVSDSSYRGVPKGLCFDKTRTRVAIGNVTIEPLLVALATDHNRRLAVRAP